ncbi:MAG TPA: 4-hydroxy-tetrahydrodipicolinate synthase [Gemmatimonadales bacterium]|nr:4-hydroxy-tetrahydrodipicolinate synthase [Gemmatimonadales bacterium]
MTSARGRGTFQGCGTAIVTPFTRDGAVDFAALARLTEWQIAEGIDFLVPCGSTGEAQTMDDAERERVVAKVVEVAAGRVPVMAGATDNDTARAVAETRRMCATGASHILSATPYYNKPTQEGLYRHFMAVLDASTRPVCLYNVPGRTAVNLKPETALRLAAHPNCLGIKEASGDLRQAMDLIRGRPEGFSVLSGEDWLAFAIVAAGGDGLISVTSNEAPAAMRAMVHGALDGKLGPARQCLDRLLPLIDANFAETNPGPVKAALAMMGKIEDVLRLPLVPAGAATRDTLRDALRTAGVQGV